MKELLNPASPAITYFLDKPATGEENMRRDCALLERVPLEPATILLRFYSFSPPCLSIGRFQSFDDIDLEACQRDGIDIVRRPTGGRAVLHQHEVTYALACAKENPDFGGNILQSCQHIHSVIVRGLRSLGARLFLHEHAPVSTRPQEDCFAQPSAQEIVDAQGNKIVGSAQMRRHQIILQHGSIVLRFPQTWKYLRHKSDSPKGRGLCDVLNRNITHDEVAQAIIGGFASSIEVHAAEIWRQGAG
jgi:lipoate-protein ligase A